MNRILLVCNAILALLLAIRLADSGTPVFAADRSHSWRADDMRVVPVPDPLDVEHSASVVPHTFLLQLGAEVAPLPLPKSPVDLGLVGEPQLELVTVWESTSILRVRVQSELLPATDYRLRFQRDLRALDGRILPASSSIVLSTPNAQVRDVLVEDDPAATPGRGEAALRVVLDLPIEPAMAQRCLAILGAADAEIPSTVEAIEGGGGKLFRIRPRSGELPPDVVVVLRKGLVPLHGKVPLARDQRQHVGVYEPLDLRGVTAGEQQVQLVFNRALPIPDPKLWKVTPAGDVRFETTERGLGVRGAFAPGSIVTIDLAAGFPGTCRSSLGHAVRRSVLVPDLSPSVGFVGDGEILSARAEPVLLLHGCNTDKVHLQLRRVYDNNVVRMFQHNDLRVFEPAVEHTLSISAARNAEWQERVDLREVLGAAPRGIYQVELRRDGEYWPETRLLQITDLGVTVRAGVDRAAVQVVSIADGTPCVDAVVTFVTPTNQELATGRTDDEGKVIVAWQSNAADRQPFLVQVQHGGDRVFVGLQRCSVELADEGLGGRPYLRDGVEASVWPSRGIVRPGETFDAAVLVRDARGAAAVDRFVDIAFVAPGGKVFRRQHERTGGSGLLQAEVQLPADAPCGRWTVTVQADAESASHGTIMLGQAGFEVATFVPNRLEASTCIEGEAQLGAPLAVKVHANWLDGTAAAGRPVQVHVRLTKGGELPKEFADYSFASGIDSPPPGELPAVEAVLDERGDAVVRLQLPALRDEQVMTANVFAEVLDPSGRVVRARAMGTVTAPEFLLGVRAQLSRLDLCSIMAAGLPIDGGEAVVRIERRHWEWRYDARGNHRWAWHSQVEKEVVHEATAKLVRGAASLPLPAFQGDGWFVAVATMGEHRCEQVLGKAPLAPDRLRVRAANSPAPGAIAQIDVESPAAGRGFVTLESDTVHAARIVALLAGHNRIEVPVPADAVLPNLHAVVTLTRPVASAKAGQGPAWLLGAANLPLSRDELRCAVKVGVAGEVLPQADLHVAIEAAGASRALVAVVDEGVLGVTGHASPDPLAFFLSSRALQITGADTGARLVHDMVFAPRAKTGGDEDDMQALMRGGSVDTHIRPLALFAAASLDGGRGSVDFHLPPYEGRVRVMVIAAGGQQLGAAASEVVVKAPLGLQVAVPRMVTPGDRFTVPVSVHNDLGHDGTVALEVAVPPGLTLPGGAHYELRVAAGQVANLDVVMQAAARSEGDQAIAITAQCEAQKREVGETIVVRTTRLPTRDSTGLRLGSEQRIQIANDWSSDRLHAEIAVDVAPDRQLRPALEAMLEYPYGCCEQTASRGMALVNCAALLPRMYDDATQAPQVLPMVQTAVDRLFAMQTTRGGFGWWLGSRDDDAFLTTYVMDFLLQAREIGAALPETAFARAEERLQDIAAEAAQIEVRCHAIEVLTRLGKTVQPRLDWLCCQPVSLAARARLAVALALLGDRQRAAELLQHAEGEPEAPKPELCLDSELRTDALLLRAMLAIDPADAALPARVAALQQQLLHPSRLTTQETAQGMRVLAEYYRRQPPVTTAPRVTIDVDGTSIAVGAGKPVELPIRPGSRITLQKGGEGFALLTVRGFAPPTAGDDGRIALSREIVDGETGLPVTQMRRGHVYEVRVHLETTRSCGDFVLASVLPGGCEVEPAVAGDALRSVLAADDGVDPAERPLAPSSFEPRDDRVLMFCPSLPKGRYLLRHRIRAVFPGDYEVPPLVAEGMYDPTLRATERNHLQVVITP